MPPWPPRPRGPSRVTRMPKGPEVRSAPPTARTIRAGSPLGSAIEILSDRADEVEWELLNVEPTSIEGAAALLAYAAEFERDGNMWGRLRRGFLVLPSA